MVGQPIPAVHGPIQCLRAIRGLSYSTLDRNPKRRRQDKHGLFGSGDFNRLLHIGIDALDLQKASVSVAAWLYFTPTREEASAKYRGFCWYGIRPSPRKHGIWIFFRFRGRRHRGRRAANLSGQQHSPSDTASGDKCQCFPRSGKATAATNPP